MQKKEQEALSHCKIFRQRGIEMIDRLYNEWFSHNFCLITKLLIETLSTVLYRRKTLKNYELSTNYHH